MHEFPKYLAPSDAEVVSLVAEHPFALVISTGEDGVPIATHTPVILDPASPRPEGGFVGQTLYGHIARANPQWRSFSPDRNVLLVFSGPHDYVSPTAYGYEPAVPTWDYTAVHLTARLELLESREDCLRIVSDTVTALEGLEDVQWDMHASIPTFERIVEHVVGFRLHVVEQRAVFKLSQDMPTDVRERVADASRARGCPYGDVASLIESGGVVRTTTTERSAR